MKNNSALGVKSIVSNYIMPTLGLKKYSNLDLQVSLNNPYRVQKDTEKLLVVRERERE